MDCNTNIMLGVGCAVLLVALFVQQCVAAMHRRNVRMLTETAALMFLGAACNGIYLATMASAGTPLLGKSGAASLARDPVVHDIVYYALLPPLIFEAGFTMRKRKFFANFASILLFAVGGTLVAILVAGGLMYALVQAPLGVTSFTFNQLLLFSSLISSTDPIATLPVLKAVRARPPLYDLIFGESALNDALSIVLFNIFKAACREEDRRGHAEAHEEQLPFGEQMGRVAGQLAIVVPLSMLLGLTFGLASGLATRLLGLHRRRVPQAELALVLAFGLAISTITEHLRESLRSS